MIDGNSGITLEGASLILGGCVALWTILSGLLKIYQETRDTRILVNVICKHLGIEPEEIIGKK